MAAVISRDRLDLANAALRDCRLCPRLCRSDRTRGPAGSFCKLGAEAWVYKELLSVGEEPAIGPTWLIDLGGCSLRCLYCSEWAHVVHPQRGDVQRLEPAWFAARHARRVAQGAQTVSFVGGDPTPSAVAVLYALAAVPEPLPVVWNCNGLLAPQAAEILRDVVAVWSIDSKFGNQRCAQQVAGARGFDAVAETATAIGMALRQPQVGRLPKLIVRHLLMPGHLDCCTRPVLAELAELLAGVPGDQAVVNLMTMYVPPSDRRGQLPNAPELGRWSSSDEVATAQSYGRQVVGAWLAVDGRRIS